MAGSAHATTVDWRDNAANGNWDNGDCAEIGEPASQWWYDGWSPNRARNEPDCFGYRHLRFDNNHQTTMTLNGRWYDANAVNFGASATTARTMGSNGLDLRSANNGITNNSTANHTWNSSIAFNANPIHFRLNSGNLTFNGSIFFKANFLEVWGNSWHTLNLNGVLDRDGGDGGLAVKANTLVIVTNNNTITGDLWAEKGAIRLGGSTNAMGNGRSINAGTNAIIELSYSNGEILRTNTWFVYGTGTNGSGAIRKTSSSGNVTIPGRIVVNQDTVIRSDGGSLIVSNVISGTPVISKLGSGTLQLSSNNTYSGKTHISNGVVVITVTNGLGDAAGDTTVIGDAALEVRGVSSYEPLVINGHGVSGTGAVYNDLTTAGATLTNTISLNTDSAVGGAGQLTLSGVISGSGQFTKTGSGTNIVSGNNTFTGVAIVSNGILRVTHTNGLGTTAGGTFVRSGGAVEWAVSSGFPAENFTLAGSGVTNGGALRHTATGTSTLRGNINLDDHATLASSAGTLNLGGFLNLSNRTLTIDNSSSISMASGSSISNATLTTGSGAIVKNGTSFFLLRPSSDLTGSITVNGGELRIGPNASGSGLVAGGTLTLNGGTKLSSDGSTGRTIAKNVVIGGNIGLAENSGGNLSFSGTVDLGGSVRIITNSASVGFMGVVSGTGGGITKRGTGTLTNGVASTYTGATTIEEGTLYLSGSLLNSAVTISTGGTLRSNSGTGFGSLTVNGLADPGGNGTNLISTIVAVSLNLGQNGKMIFDISNVTGSPGSQWDRFLVNSGGGTITIGATSGNKFTLRVTGNPTGWDNTQSYSWLFADGGTMVSFASDRFAVEVDSSFPSLGGGTFAVTNSGGDLFLAFTPAGGPDIEARGNGAAIVSGDTTPSLTDHTDFGDVLTTGGTLTRTYTFTNAGVASVGLGNISFSGGNAGDFTVVNQLPDSLAAGGTTNIQITFDPSADGTRSTTLTFTNTVTGKTPYTFTIQGTGVTRNIDVRGNGTTIADGDTSPSTSDHTDFGSVGITGDSLVRTYTITNTGNREVGIGNVSVSGTHAADYSVTTQPADSLAAGATTTFQVTFDPSAAGLRSASLSFTNTTSTGKSPYNFDIQGTGAGSGISNFPTTLAFSSVLGSLPSPAFQAFGITNVGLGSMTYSLTTNASWLIVSNVSGTAAAGAGNVHTASVQLVTGIAAGTSNATITITGDANTTNSPKTISVSWTISAIPDPSAVAVQAEGPEFVRLLWTKDASYDVLIVHRGTNAPTAPANNTAYNIGDAVGSDGSRVIYKGSAAFFEHIVAPGSTNHYAFYSINNNFYSPGVAGSAVSSLYPSGVIIDHFAYTNGLTMGSRNGGSGWSASWTANSGTFTVNTSKFTAINGYTAAGNTITGNNASIRRDFTAVTSGKIYALFMLRTDNGGSSQYSGLSFFDGATEEKFIGEGFSQVNQLTVGSATGPSGRQLANNTDYTIIARYDFGTDVFSAVLYTNGTESLPATEPSSWHVTETDSSVSSINRIRLESNVGTRWDEIRIATNYTELLQLTQPSATSYTINQGTNVTDGQVVSGAFTVRYDFYDSVGMSNSASIPNFDLVNPSNVVILTNHVFGNVTYSDAGRVQRASNTTHTGASGSAVVLGVYTSRWTAINSNGVTITDSTTLSNGTVTTFTVVDDDTDFPVVTGLRFAGGTSLTDGQLFAGGWSFTGLVQDTGSGIDADGTAGSDPFPPHFDILNPTGTEAINNATFTTTPSDGAGLASAAPLARSAAAIAAGDISLGSWTARVYVADNDNDRTGDRLTTIEQQAFTVTDDDTTGPVHSGFTGRGRTLSGGTYTNSELGSGLVVTGLVTDAQSGVYGGTSNRWTLFRNNVSVNSGAFTALFADGTAVSSNGQLTATIASGDVSASGSYTLRVFSVNYDIDRAGDSESTSTDVQFTVVAAPEDLDLFGNNVLIPDGDTTPSLADHTDFGDVLVDGGTLTRTYTITNSGAAVLGIGNVTTNAGGNPTNFIVTVQPAASLAIGATTTFQVQFNPSTSGTAFADIQFTSTVASAKTPYTFRVQGTGTYVEIAVTVSGVSIADGDATPSTADGTDFGSVGVNGATSNITYTITNSGNRAMSLGSVTTSGTHAADFIVTAQPASTLNPSNTTTFTVQFNPSAVGLRSAALSFSTTDDAFEDGLTENPFNFSIQGTGAGSGISNFPTSLAFSSVLGSLPSPAFQAFGITNVGLGSMTYSLTTNAAWLVVSNVAGTAAAGAGNVHTASVQLVSGLAVGTSNATITITGDSATTNSPKTISVAWTISAIPDPTAQTATGDGAELVRLNWTKNASYDVMIIHDTAAISTEPTQGTAYNVGDTLGTGRVLYKGSGAALEHIVAAGSAAHYKFYSINNNYYSPGVSANVTLSGYGGNEIVEPFAYTNNANFGVAPTENGGAGWSTAWSVGAGTWTVSSGSMNVANFYPTEYAYSALMANPGNGSLSFMTRTFPAVTTGSIYFAYIMRYQFNGADKYAGMELTSNGTARAFFGEIRDQDRRPGVALSATSSALAFDGTYGLNDFNTDTGNVYAIVGRYNFETRAFVMNAYYKTVEVPLNEPSTWNASNTLAAGQMNMIDGVRLIAGSSDGGATVGQAFFDEVRVARTWTDLLRLTQPVATSYAINGGSDVTDAQVASGTYPVVFTFYDSVGVSNTASLPNFDLWNSAGTRILTNQGFASKTHSDAGRVLLSSNATHAGAVAASVTLGSYTSRWTAANSNGVLTVNSDTLSNGTRTVFTVVDDDTTPPVIGTFIGQGRALSGAVYTNTEFTGGFWVTGTVTDAFSGLFANSNTFVLTRDGSAVSSGVFAVNFANGGATAGGLVSNNFPLATMIAGAYTLTVYAVDYDIDRTDDSLRSTNVISFSVVEPPSAPGLAVGPLTLSYTAMLGSNPDVLSTFNVTNVGSAGTLIYTNFQTYGTGATGWFAANPTNISLGITGVRIHTGHVASATFNATGTYTATNRVAGNQTNAAQEIVVTLVVTAIPPPTAVSATPSGAEFVRVYVTEPSGRQILIVSRQTNAPSADPTQGTAYNLGDTLGGGRVVYKGTASYFEQVVQPGSTNFYNVYTINNDRYSAVTTVGATTTVYGAGVIIEPFAYTNNTSLSGVNGGTGWTNAWTVGSGGYGFSTSLFSAITGYPADAGNVVTGTSSSAYREFAEYTSGKLYVSYKFRISNGSGYAGLSFFNNGSEQIFFGESGLTANNFAVDGGGGNAQNGGTLANDTDYTIIGMYDFDNNIARGWIFTNATQSIPSSEPAAHAQITDGDPTRINRVRLESGSGTVVTRWDEIRIATTWDALLAAPPTYIWDAGGGADRDWSTAANWTADTEPTATNDAFIGGSYTGVITVAGEVAANLYIGQGQTGTVLQTGGTLGVNNLFLGYSNTAVGIYTLSGGSATVATDMVVGAAGAATATVHGAGSLLAIGANLQIGLSNANNRADFLHNNGTVTVANVYIGRNSATEGHYIMSNGVLVVSTDIFLADGNANSTGRLDVSGGRIDVGNIYVGRNGLGLMNISGSATVNVIGANSDIFIGDLASNNRSNRLTISGGTVNVGDNIELGDAANTFGSMLMSGGTLSVTGAVSIGDVAGSTGQVTVTGGNIQILENLSIGNAGLGQMEVHGGSVTASIIRVSDASGSAGSTLIVGGGRLVAAGTTDFEIDFSGTATVTGGVLEAHDIDLGTQAGSLATLNIGGNGTVIANNPFNVGFASGATGVVTQTGGTLDLVSGTATFNVGAGSGYFGFYTITGGVITTDHNFLLGSSDATGTGVFHVVGSAPSITIGDGTTEDFTMQSAAAELRVTFVNSGLAPILVQDDITVAGTLTISNTGPWAAGTYTVVTSLNSSAVIGTFASINWLGGTTGTVTYTDRAVRITVDGNIPNPTNQTATADGKELIRLGWNPTYTNVMIVHRAGAPVSGDPVQGTPYNVGDSLGGGTVIYKGSATNREHVVGQGTTHHYEFFSYTGNFYSTGVTASATTEVYAGGEHVEQFAYTNTVALGGLNGGQGWTNAWSVSVPNSAVDAVIDNVNFVTFQPQWPDEKANRVVLKTTNSSVYEAFRNFSAVTSGKIYVAALYRREFNEGADGKYSGIRFVSGTTPMAFVGERGGVANDDIFGVSTAPGTPTDGVYGSANSFPAATDYLIIARYDFDTDTMSGIYYTDAQSVPSIEPTYFVNATNASITSIDGISLVSGADSGWNGQVFFDELRVATSWADLLRLTGGPYATNYVIGNATNYVFDGQIRDGTYTVAVDLRSGAGIETVSTTPPYFIPNYDLLNPLGVQIVTDRAFNAFAYIDSGLTVRASNTSQSVVGFADTVLGTYTGRWSAISSNGLVTINSATLSNGTAITFTVVDDDTAAPTVMAIHSPEFTSSTRFMQLSSNNTAVGSVGGTSGTNITYRLTDHYLANHLSNATPLVFYFGARDAGSGLSRGTTDAGSQSFLTIGSAIVSNVFNWDTTRSSAFSATTNTSATSAWSWVGAMLPGEIDNLVTNTASGVAGSNRVSITWRDADNDRANDRDSLLDSQHGWLVVTDDDTTPPQLSNFAISGTEGVHTASVVELLSGSLWSITGRVVDGVSQGNSGINVNGTNTVQPNSSPYFELWDPNGVMQLRQAFNNIPFGNGGATTLTVIGSSNNTAVASAITGTWTARVFVADADNDRTSDRSIATNEFTFEVVTGASLAGMQVNTSVLNITSSFGTVSGGGTWPNFTVTNNGLGPLIYSATISYNGGSGWLTVNPNTSVTVNDGQSQIHTAAVNVASLNPGTYQAVVALAGNQTNGTRYVTNNLTVIGYFVNEIVDPFTNTAGTALNGLTGGTGWTNAWNSSTFSLTMTNLSVPNNYPAAVSNKICGSTASEITARRYFPSVSTGKLFAAVAMRKDANDNNGYAGISFMEGATERVFAGKIFNSQWLGIDFGGSSTESGFGIYQSTYLIVLYYDFDADVIRTRAFNPGDTLSLTEPSTWSLVRSNAVITSIDGIRLAGSAVGNLCFDEVRVARTWETLLNQFSSEPTLHASALTFANITTSSMTVGWTPGNGAARIVVAREGAAVTFTPVDGSNYTANADFSTGIDLGSGQKVIYNGSGSSVDFVSLNSETQYFFRVFEYNGSSGSSDYLTSGTPLNGSRWTLKIEPSEDVINFNAFTGGDSTITNTWTAPGGTYLADGYVILRRNGDPVVDAPVDGVSYTNNQVLSSSRVAVVSPGTVESFLQSNLTACADYHFAIFPYRVNSASGETINYMTNSPATASASTTCDEPNLQASNIVFSVIGTNTVTVNWENGNGTRRMVVVRGTNAVNQHPVDGMSYTSSATFGSGTHLGDGNYVVYRDTGTTVTVIGLAPGVTYHFRVYEFNGSGGGSDYNTNTAVNNPRSTATAAFGLVFEPFAYGNFVNLSGLNGGTGWTNSWSTAGGLVETSNGNFPNFGAYPPDGTSVSGFMDMGNFASAGRSASRNFPAMTSGRMYIAIKMSPGTHSMGTSDYLGVDLLNGGVTTGFFGKASGTADRRLSVEHNGSTRTNRLDGSNSGYQINASTDYLLVAMYDFIAREFKVRAYTTDNLAHANPDREAAWTVEMTNVNIDRVDGIKIVASDNNQIVSFDSIRIGPSWEEVMWGLRPQHHELNGPVPTLVYIGTNYSPSVYGQIVTNLSDAELKSVNNIDFAVRWDSPLGVFLTNAVATNRNIGSPNARVSPNWDPLAIGLATNEFNLDRFFTNYFGINGATSVTTFQYNAFNITNINFENQYFVTVSAENNPGGGTVAAPNGASWDAVPTNRAITINTPLRFFVYDDDTNVPVRGTGGMAVLTSAVPASAQAVGDVFRYFVTDGVLASNGMDISLRAYDDYSGLQRSASGDPATNMNLTIDGFVTNNIAHYSSAKSSADSLVSTATNTWSFSNTNFTWQRITDLWGGDGSGSAGQDFDVLATVPDADDDRVDDQAILSNELFGLLRILDDDVDAPTNQNITYGGISVLNRSFYVGTNGFAIGSGDTSIRGTYDRRSGVGNNTIFAITDEEMASSGSRGLEFAFGVIDAGSGISRGASGSTNDVMSFSVGNILSGVVTGFNGTLSSAANQANVLQTNVWTFSNGALSENVITQLMHRTGSSATGSVEVTIRVPDNDNDRFNDRATFGSARVGYLQVLDDDVTGPTMTAVDVRESTGGDSILATSFETSQGWPVSSLSSSTIWTNTDPYGAWIGQGVTHTSLDPKQSGTRRLGFLTNAFAQSWLQLPPISNPGSLSIYAGRVGTGAGDPGLALERWDGVSWVGYGTNLVTVPGYVAYSWNIDEAGSNLQFRIRRVDTAGVFRTQVYADDISINSRPTWIGTNSMTNTQVTINWAAAVDDYSGIEDYHIVPPAVGSIPPATTNDGTPISAAFTSSVQSLLGQQGVITGFIFAVDDDSDRQFDRSMGNVVSIVLRVDTNPPVAVQEASTVIDATIDDTTEIKVIWSNHVSEAQAAGWRQSDTAPLSDWDSYIIRYHELDISSPVTTELTRSSAGWSNLLSNHLFTNMILSNLNFDARYAISVMGRDEAGNIGPAVTVTGITTIFSVTQGFNRVDRDLEVQWIWNEERTYDVVYVDSLSMSDSFTNQWQYLTTITNAGWMTDTGSTALARARPTTLNNTLRFYRVSRQGAWTTNNNLRRGSVEVYTTKPLNLYTGENWHSLFFIPDTATVAYVFNTNILPRGATMAESTRISWFSPTAGGTTNQNGAVTAMVWLASSGQWLWQIGGPLNSNADNKLVPLDQGFLIEIPGDPQTNQAPALSMMIIGLVPTQQVTQVIAGGSTASNRIHILSHNMPVRVPISSMGFRGSGFTGNNNGVLADEVRILSQGGNGSLQNPKARLRLRSDGTTWQYYTTPGPGSAGDPAQFIIEPDDAVIIIRRNAATMTWTNKLWYTPPNKNFNP